MAATMGMKSPETVVAAFQAWSYCHTDYYDNYPFLSPTVIIIITHAIFQRVSLFVFLEHVSQYSADIKY